MPHFLYHPDPLATGSFVEGEAKLCPSCGKESNVYYALRPYSIEEIVHLCPTCIANGQAAKKFDAEFIQDAEWQGELDPEKNQLLFVRPQATLVGRRILAFLLPRLLCLLGYSWNSRIEGYGNR